MEAFEEDWQQQVDEVVALQAIYGENDFSIVSCDLHASGGASPDSQGSRASSSKEPEDAEDEREDWTGDALAALPPPSNGWSLSLRARVDPELPAGTLRLLIPLGNEWGAGGGGSNTAGGGASEPGTSASGSSGASTSQGAGAGARLPMPSASTGAGAGTSRGSNGAGVAGTSTAGGSNGSADGTGGAGGWLPAGQVSYLPPLIVSLRLRPGYPSRQPPSVALSAAWLAPGQAAALVRELTKLWKEQGEGYPVIFSWLDWLKTSALGVLGISDVLQLSAESSATAAAQPDSAGVDHSASDAAGSSASGQACSDASAQQQPALPAMAAYELALRLLQYSAAREQDAFDASPQLCEICYEEVLGAACTRLPDCRHFYCTACLQQHCQTQVDSGAVDNLKCPSPDCRHPLRPATVRDLLGAEAFERWEGLLLQRTLDKMDDVVYCPRCTSLCLEDSDHMGECGKCFYVFCSLCCDSYHPGTECLDPDRRLHILKQRQERRAGTHDPERARKELDKANQALSLQMLAKTTKNCPVCNMGIDKSEGCNKMTCGYCGAYFCWGCGERVTGYDHFKEGGCTLFDQEAIDAWNRLINRPPARVLEAEYGQQRVAEALAGAAAGGPPVRLCRCPGCGQANLKVANNNLIQCWACASHFCAACRQRLGSRPGLHFGVSKPCKQHTAD